MPSELPVWYIQAGIEKDGKFVCLSQGSAVLVTIRKEGEVARKILITAQHVLRSGAGQRTGTFHPQIRAWVPGKGYNEKAAVSVTLFAELSPKDTADLVDDEDFAFLELPPGAGGAPTAKVMNDADCRPGIGDLTVSGYPNGEKYIAAHNHIIDPSEHPEWRYTGNDPLRALGILAPGDAPPREGVSGGGVFLNKSYAGVYRGEFAKIGEHLFLPVTRLREWCSLGGHGAYTLLGSSEPSEPVALPPVRQTILSEDLLLLDRDTFRDRLELLMSPTSPKKIILVRGPRSSGKSHVRHLFDRMAQIQGANSVYLCDGLVVAVPDLLIQLFAAVGASDKIPPAMTSPAAWYGVVCTRLMELTALTGKQLWIAMDDLGDNDDKVPILDPEIRAFFDQFALQMINPAFSKWFRLLLIHYPPGTPTRWKSAYWTEDLATADGVQHKEVKTLLLEWCSRYKRRFIETELDAQAAEVITLADTPPVPGETQRPRLERIHDLLLEKLVKLHSSHS